MTDQYPPPRAMMTPKRRQQDDLIREMEQTVADVAKQTRPVEPEQVKQGVADDLAKFIETHADDMMKEAQQHRDEAYAYAKEIRDRTAEQIARLKAYTDSIKQSQAEMAEVRMRFVSAGTKGEDK